VIEELRADCPYGPGGFLIDEILEIDREQSFVRGRMPTHDDLPITREQRAHPVRHPPARLRRVMVHMTGMIAYVHTYAVMGLKHSDGWVGYGGKIYAARFKALARPGEPMILECKATRHAKERRHAVCTLHVQIFPRSHPNLRRRSKCAVDEGEARRRMIVG